MKKLLVATAIALATAIPAHCAELQLQLRQDAGRSPHLPVVQAVPAGSETGDHVLRPAKQLQLCVSQAAGGGAGRVASPAHELRVQRALRRVGVPKPHR
jgi:hypothetical protein